MAVQATINQTFSIRSMLKAVEQWKIPQRFLLNMFFKEQKEYVTKYVEIDFRDEKRSVAPFVRRDATGQVVSHTGYDKFIYEPPYMKPRSSITPSELQETMIGENIYSTTDPGFRMTELRNLKLMELEHMIQRREELMAKQALFDKAIQIVNENGDSIGETITFTRASELDYSASILWSSATTAKPVDDIDESVKLIQKYTGLGNIIAVHGTESARAFRNTDQVKNYLDNRRYEIGSVFTEKQTQADQMGVIYFATINGVDHYEYNEWYLDTNGTLQELIPTNKCLVGSTMARSIVHYGAIETANTESMIVRGRRVPQYYPPRDQDPPVYGLQLHSAPLTATHQPDAFSVITTVAA